MQTKRVLFITIPEKGHLNPLIGIAQYIRSKGYTIAFYSQADISTQLSSAGIDCKTFKPKVSNSIPSGFITKGADFALKIKNKEWLRDWIKTLLIDLVPSQLMDIQAVIKQYDPQVVVCDPMVYAGAIASETLGIPWVGVSNSLNPLTPSDWRCELVDTLNSYHQQRVDLFRNIGREVNFCVSDLISPWLNIVFSTEEYIPRDLSGNQFSFYVGTPFPIDSKRGDETSFPFGKLDPCKKKVYMSLGSQIYYHPHLFKTVAKALEKENVQIIMSVSELCNDDFVEFFPPDSIILPYVPQLEVLKHVDLMVSHGGANSVLESLAAGIPLAILPLCNDQFLQAKFVQRAGVGMILDAECPDAIEYREVLTEILSDDSSYRSNAKRIQASFLNYGGSKQAGELIIELLENQKPLMPL